MWENLLSPVWSLLKNNFAFFFFLNRIQADFFFFSFSFVDRPWAFCVVRKHVIFICFFFT